MESLSLPLLLGILLAALVTRTLGRPGSSFFD
jgi:hypothetical protein